MHQKARIEKNFPDTVIVESEKGEILSSCKFKTVKKCLLLQSNQVWWTEDVPALLK